LLFLTHFFLLNVFTLLKIGLFCFQAGATNNATRGCANIT